MSALVKKILLIKKHFLNIHITYPPPLNMINISVMKKDHQAGIGENHKSINFHFTLKNFVYNCFKPLRERIALLNFFGEKKN